MPDEFLDDKETLAENIKDKIDKLLEDKTVIDDETVLAEIERETFRIPTKRYISIEEKGEIIKSIFNSVRRLDVIQPLIDNIEISEIMINGYKDIFVEKNGEIEKTNVKFKSNEKLMDIIQIIVSKVNRMVNESSPIVDARLTDGSRVNIVLPPIAIDGPIMTIRKFPVDRITVDSLIEFETITKECAEFLDMLVKNKYNILISGGTSSGKTTMLNVLASMIKKDERIITIEDSAELQIVGIPNIVRLETRNMNTEEKGEIKIKDLIRTALRMRPDRIIIGEIRGEEAFDMLVAMNTGHDGSICTGHANSAQDMLRRLETMVLSGVELPIEVIRRNIESSIDIIIHLSKMKNRKRKVVEISEISGMVNGKIELNRLYKLNEQEELICVGKLMHEKNGDL